MRRLQLQYDTKKSLIPYYFIVIFLVVDVLRDETQKKLTSFVQYDNEFY